MTVLDRGAAWLDTGSLTSVMQSTEFVRVIEERQGVKVGCLEAAVWRARFIDDERPGSLGTCGYGSHLSDQRRPVVGHAEPGGGAGPLHNGEAGQ
ncbi:glycosyltransferase family protein [Rhizomonospora bruguierae]|uniref:hypothetical protein n=1 Tax=Rhizomonospora bruguierae TaxID=1581705 RepID=UPI0020BF2ABB|nr:hypothetical protein [Micromonospora sp. NBRC 107566]